MDVLSIVGVLTALIIVAIGYMITKASSSAAAAAVAAPTEEAELEEKKKKKKKGNLGLAKMKEKHKQGQASGGLDGRAAAVANDLPTDAGADSEEDVPSQAAKKIGAKKAAKLEAKAEKKAYQEALKKEREDAKQREDLRFEESKKEREAEANAEKEAEEEEARKVEEQKKKEQEEYEAMKASFSVEEAGSVAETIQTESQGLLTEFIDYIKDTKVVLLEDLATRFGLKTQDAILRLKNLEEMGSITGVMDDRGKYIYISDDEMNAVVKFIKQRGRVSKADLSENSHKLIRLQSNKKEEETKSG